MENKRSLAGLMSFLAITFAAIIFIIEYAIGASGYSWAKYLLIAKDVFVAIGIILGSLSYVKHSGIIVKLLFYSIIIIYVVFAVLSYAQVGF